MNQKKKEKKEERKKKRWEYAGGGSRRKGEKIRQHTKIFSGEAQNVAILICCQRTRRGGDGFSK